MTAYDLARGLHILAVIAWMAGLLFLPRLYAYDAEQADKPEPLRGEMRALLRTWQRRLSRIILDPAMGAAWVFGAWLIWLDGTARGWGFLLEPWMVAKLAGVLALSGWHVFLQEEGARVRSNTSVRSGRFWRMTNEIPFVIAVIMVLSVTTEWTLG